MELTLANAIVDSNSVRQFAFCYEAESIRLMNEIPERDIRVLRLREFVSDAGGAAEVARKHDVDATYISQLLNGHRSFGERSARNMEAKLGLPRGWLDQPPSEIATLKVSDPSAVYTVSPRKPDDEFLPVRRARLKLSAGAHGFGIEYLGGNSRPIFFRADWFKTNDYKPDRLLSLKVSGQSMEPSLWEDDLIVINLDETRPIDGEVYAANYEGEAVIKRLKRDGGEWWLTSDNPDKRRFPDKRCTEDVQIIGRAIYKQSSRI